ncbi:TetR/AcrR family transcriptional regulator [Mycolicibacterium palauense]|uniref:TetR/AcrR family transcriptional regulator n=1 Tax=Mycolicibacterium palauense TaxID=2034511 RepID=UPI000BFEBA83|nr:TetR family transcriptional regulator [Mycolicibacterium palauense]
MAGTHGGPKRRGRPSGPAGDTRERILASARDLFARNGMAATSVRAVAAAAGVDAALVHHYFGTKKNLFTAAIDIPVDPDVVLERVRAVPLDELGRTIPSVVLPLWEYEAGAGMKAALRSALAGDRIAMFEDFLREIVLAEVARRVDDPPGFGIVRAEFVATQVLGVVVARHIVELEPFASLPLEQIIDTIAPNLQRYLTADLPR